MVFIVHKVFSVKVLCESIITPKPDNHKTFEESILLVETQDVNFIKDIMEKHFVDNSYKNGYGAVVNWKLVAILDVFELVDSFECSVHLKEVYSRFLTFEKQISAKEVIELYSLDR